MSPSPLKRGDLVLGLLLGIGFVVLLLATSKSLGFTRDEGFYFSASDQYVQWFGALVADPGSAVRREAVESAWRHNHEHPPLMKSLFGLSHRLLDELGLVDAPLRGGRGSLLRRIAELVDEPSASYRLPAMLMAGLAVCLLYLFGTEIYGRTAGLAAAVAFGLAPRPFFHSHLACFDIPVTAMILAITYAYWRSLGSRHPGRFALLAGVLFGLGLLTKINALFVPATLLAHYAVVYLRGRQVRRYPLVPRALAAMAVVGPILFIGLWPWLWFDTVGRILRFVGFFTDHAYYNIEYLGVTYFRPPFPLSYAWGMLLFTLPATTIAAIVLGAMLRGRALLPGRWANRLGFDSEPDERRTDLLILWSALVPILLICNSRSPIFGGTKHFLPAVPFLALLAGAAVQRVLGKAASALRHRTVPTAVAVVSLAVLLVAPLARETWRSHPFGLSHYNVIAGGTPGAADIGLCRQFWGFTTGSLTGWLNRVVPRGGSVQFHDTAYDSYRMLQRDGRLRADIRYASEPGGASFALVHHEQHWAIHEYPLWASLRTAVPVKVLTHQGVPIISVFAPSDGRSYERPGSR